MCGRFARFTPQEVYSRLFHAHGIGDLSPRSMLRAFAIAALLLLTPSTANAYGWSGHIGGLVGMKTLNSGDWPDLDRHFAMGFLFDIKEASWPFSIALDFLDTGAKHSHDGTEDLGHTSEYHLGVRKILVNRHPKFHPYVEGGVAFMYAEQQYLVKEADRDLGSWFGAGAYYAIRPRFALGLDVRYSHGKLILFGKERQAGGVHTYMTGAFQF